jgi:predicted nuclease of restriction endonuclease-like (RecB) superfamily
MSKKTVSSQPLGYEALLSEVKQRIQTAQYNALKVVNKELLNLYWDLGKTIAERQDVGGRGAAVVAKLSEDLMSEFGAKSGFSARNLHYMRTFYLEYKDLGSLQPLVAEISWSKHIVILSQCKQPLEREFYLRSTARFGWTKNVLIHQVENKTYEKYLLNDTNFDQTLPAAVAKQARLAVKDHYTFEFLGLAEQHAERELEQALLANVKHFLAEMGANFTFISNQYRLTVGGNDYFIDLLLYHRQLKSLIAIELRIGEFQPEHKGKMEFYLTALNEQVKLPDENEAIGIIICKSKNKTVVEYALKTAMLPIGVATYSLTPHLPENYRNLLPSEDEIASRLAGWDTE